MSQWPSYSACLVSFVTIGPVWIEHHGVMGAVRSINRRFLERTLVFLLFVSIPPCPTAIAAEYADRGFGEARIAAILYASTMLLMGLSFAWRWRYLSDHSDMIAKSASPAFPAGARRATLGGLAYLVAILVALVSPAASFAIDALVVVYFVASRTDVPGLIYRAARSEDDA